MKRSEVEFKNGKAIFVCTACHKKIAFDTTKGLTTGYGVDQNDDVFCFPCCGKSDVAEMKKTGKHAGLYLYSEKGRPKQVGNWPGSLKFAVKKWRNGQHACLGGVQGRIDVWFDGPDEKGKNRAIWHGVQRGDNNDIVRCARTKYRDYGEIP